MQKKVQYIHIEIILLFLGVPFLVSYFSVNQTIIPSLILISLIIYLIHRNNSIFKESFQSPNVSVVQYYKKTFPFLLLLVGFILLTAWIFVPDTFLRAPPDISSLFLLFAYPLFSVIPQEIIFRSFFFSRYRPYFKHDISFVFLNSFLFSFAHIMFNNIFILFVTFVGSLFLCYVYLRTKSIWIVVLEHSLYGLVLLFSGYYKYMLHAMT